MKKKLRNYIKFSLCALLILGASIVSYAALSSADGSTFVTKKEFDKAFDNLNTRMLVFENNMESQIESQVSAYLDNNGIWDGEKQIIEDNCDSYIVGIKGADTTKSISIWYATSSGRTTTGINARTVVSTGPISKKRFVKSITKSGLCCLSYSIHDKNPINSTTEDINRESARGTKFSFSTSDKTTGYDIAGSYMSDLITFNIFEDDRQVFSYPITVQSGDIIAITLFGLEIENCATTFFVSEGKSLYFSADNDFNGNEYGRFLQTDAGRGVLQSMEILDATVY